MNLYEFLSHPAIELPIRPDWTDDFHGFVRKRFDRFLEALSQLDGGPVADCLRTRVSSITTYCDNLSRSLESSLDGRLQEGYRHFNAAIQAVVDELNVCTVSLAPLEAGVLYRVRQTKSPKLEKEDIFHIPFEDRHKVPSHRYSIPGLPCLYLCGSLYACWEELGRPPFHELQAAAFWVKEGESVKVLDFSKHASQLLWLLKPGGTTEEPPKGTVTVQFLETHIAANITLWPLMASSAVIVKNCDSPFKPEYLIPQMLLQWVRESDFDGICYFSTNVQAAATKVPLPLCNFVFPAKVIRPHGRCEHLCSIFKMTKPYGWEFLRAIHVGEGGPGGVMPVFDIKFIEGIEEAYHNSEFAAVQMRLNKVVVSIMQQNGHGSPGLGDIPTE